MYTIKHFEIFCIKLTDLIEKQTSKYSAFGCFSKFCSPNHWFWFYCFTFTFQSCVFLRVSVHLHRKLINNLSVKRAFPNPAIFDFVFIFVSYKVSFKRCVFRLTYLYLYTDHLHKLLLLEVTFSQLKTNFRITVQQLNQSLYNIDVSVFSFYILYLYY